MLVYYSIASLRCQENFSENVIVLASLVVATRTQAHEERPLLDHHISSTTSSQRNTYPMF
jgi:hypothetical protein